MNRLQAGFARVDITPELGVSINGYFVPRKAEALRMLRLENGPEAFRLPLSGIAIGNVAMIGIAGEPFTGIGRALKEAPGWDLVLPTCATNGYEGYFPMMDAYDEGGYEARSSNFKAGVAELLIAEGLKLLEAL